MIILLFFAFDHTGIHAQTVNDIDGNAYKTVTIGTQTWMAENLKTSRFSDSIEIPLVSESKAWAALSSPGYCWYENDSASNKSKYGALYNWYAVQTGKLCPSGWHVPNDDEWNTLITLMGGGRRAGDNLDKVGFTGLRGGYRDPGGASSAMGTDFCNLGYYSYWWSSSDFKMNKAWFRYLYNYDNSITKGFISYKKGNSVRCIRD